jgi:hypothetical protein
MPIEIKLPTHEARSFALLSPHFLRAGILPLRSKKALPSWHSATHFCLAQNQLQQSRQWEE